MQSPTRTQGALLGASLFYGAVPLLEKRQATAILDEEIRTYRVDGISFPGCGVYFHFADRIARVLEPVAQGRNIDVRC